ncbi:hypothetical protein Hanom_Chr09g00800791 [Helianthus anomalus]
MRDLYHRYNLLTKIEFKNKIYKTTNDIRIDEPTLMKCDCTNSSFVLLSFLG